MLLCVQELSFFILLGNTAGCSPGGVARFLLSHAPLLTLEYDGMREVLRCILHQAGTAPHCGVY